MLSGSIYYSLSMRIQSPSDPSLYPSILSQPRSNILPLCLILPPRVLAPRSQHGSQLPFLPRRAPRCPAVQRRSTGLHGATHCVGGDAAGARKVTVDIRFRGDRGEEAKVGGAEDIPPGREKAT